MRTGINPDGVQLPGPAYSQVVISGDLVYTSGQVARDVDGSYGDSVNDMESQTRRTFENIRVCLAAAGCTFDDVMKVSTFLGKNQYFSEYDRIYREFFSEPYPARTTVAVEFDDNTMLEVDVVARKPGAS